MTKIWRRAAALLLAVLMCVSLLPVAAMAEEAEDEPQIIEQTEPAPEEGAAPEGEEEAEPAAEEETEEAVEPEETETAEDPGPAAEEIDAVAEEEEDAGESESVRIPVTVDSTDPNGPVGLVAEATRESIILHLNRVGDSGTAKIYRYRSESYFSGDKMRGMSKNLDNGEYLGDYACGSSVDLTLARYTSDGVDHLYDKYYVLQGTKILSGPVYASEIYSFRNIGPFEVKTKKGLTVEDSSTVYQAIDMGVGNTVVNWDLCSTIYANEDANGNPIDNSGRNAYEFESNGETFYIDAQYVKDQDGIISAYSKAGINVSLVVISWAKTRTRTYPEALRYNTNNQDTQTLAFNTSNELGRKYWIACMEFLAERYSKSTSFGLVDQFIIGNEIDYTYDWYLLQPGRNNRVEFNTFMEEFARTFRLANLAVKKYNAGAKVVVSLTHNWAENCLTSYGYSSTDTSTVRYNSYAPKEIVDWLSTYEKARGDYDWGLSVHPYPIGTTSSNPTITDLDPPGVAKPITGNCNTSPWITAANLELYQLYLDKPQNQYKGQTRTVSITEGSICNLKKEQVSAEEYRQSTYEQAASVAMYYYRAACVPCINEIAYFEYHDQSPYRLGLAEENGNQKPSYTVWKYVDTNKSFAYTNRYLKYIVPGASSYYDIMDVTKSGFDWAAHWDEEILMPRYIGEDSAVERSIISNKTVYAADEPILLTARGGEGDRVCLFLASDDLLNAEPIYEYPVVGTRNNVTYSSGATCDIRAYGALNMARLEEAKLKAGDYVAVLRPGTGDSDILCPITLSADSSMGAQKLELSTDKTTYLRGEDIIVTAYGNNSSSWAGLYHKGDKPGTGTGTVTSIYWYYCNDEANGQPSGKPTIIQNTTSNSGGTVLEPGEYVVYLFADGGYTIAAQVEIVIEEVSGITPLTGISYKIDDPADGFANGTVTVTYETLGASCTDCVMFWADESGTPLPGIGALAKFKLTGKTTKHEMYPYSIIPEGAKKLIAFGANGKALSDESVSCDLPEGCTYHIGEDPIVEFQIVSDVHVTTDAGASGEVKLSNQHFAQMLEDIKINSPDSVGIFINGDIANTGSNEEFQKVYNLWQRAQNAGNGTVPNIHMSIGNHDWIQGNPNNQFQKWAKILNPDLSGQPETVYYDEVVAGYHFVYLGGEKPGLHASLSRAQLDWFDGVMQKCTEEDPTKPVFVFLHQSFYNTVSGSLPGQGWDGVDNENALKKVMQKYGQIVYFNGHSHWELNSTNCVYGGDEMVPAALNTAAVGYLWTSYNITGGEFADGSNGYTVKVYDDKIIFLGREFETSEYIPSAMFVIQRNEITTDKDEYNLTLNKAGVNMNARSAAGGQMEYKSLNTSVATVLEDGTIIARNPGETTIVIRSTADNTHVIGFKVVKVRVSQEGVFRIFGHSRYDTAIKVADALKEELGVEKFDAIIVATGNNYADALSGAYLGYVKKAPILLVHNSVINDVKAYIRENLAEGGTLYLLGGPAVVPNQVAEGLGYVKVSRLYGSSRFDTNIAILKEAGVTGGDIVVADGMSYADSLSASGAMRPVLLVNKKLTEDQKTYLKGLSGGNYYLAGGTFVLPEALEKDLRSNFGSVTRLGGHDRFETSVKVAQAFFPDPICAVLAYGMNYPDGLCGGTLAAYMGGPLLLVHNSYASVTADFTSDAGIGSGVVLGGPTFVSDQTVKTIFNMPSNAEVVVK
ncbi:MAG: cell wall-binding repeat-containing protein [Oscillospiraceae bacterium]|nr:cell wall-binding repeat-containing protein [Oscillospiraceae bacterium]